MFLMYVERSKNISLKERTMSYRLGIDSGGTFTDVVLFDGESGQLRITKTLSTPENPSIGVFNGIQKIMQNEKVTADEIASLIHGTTVATNALLEYKGTQTALILTKGFKDILSIVRQDRPKLYDYFERRPDPLVPRHLRFEVDERILYNGHIQIELNETEVLDIVDRLKSKKIRTLAVCLLHSYMNPAHEKRIKTLFEKYYPEAAVSISSDILPEIREYERMSTTVVNAYVMPIVERYLEDLNQKMADSGIAVTLNVMQSNGGILPSELAQQRSVSTILSGPAGGVIGSQWIAQFSGVQNLITIDMGGTSADICLIRDGRYLTSNESEMGGHAIKVPMIDINTIGAGGGSIAWIDTGGLLRVGPKSAGADPGPACYGKGGDEPTVTDANLVLGRLNPDYYVGGEMLLDVQKARNVIQKKIADPLKLHLEKAAEGILKVVNANMIRGIRLVSVERGHDPRRFSLFAFGGSGPLQASDLASELRIPEVIVPVKPGVNSAVGLLIADFRCDYSQTYLTKFSDINLKEIDRLYFELEKRALQHMLDGNVAHENIVFVRSADIRYHGQGYEIEVPVTGGKFGLSSIDTIKRAFDETHFRLYGYSQPQEEKEIVYLRLTAIGQVHKPEFYSEPFTDEDPAPAFKEARRVYMDGEVLEASIYERSYLKPGNRIKGPAIIEQTDSTTLIKKGDEARVDSYFNLILAMNQT
jgi:N-methylhydantoinase A